VSVMEPINDATNGDEEIHVLEVPEMMFDNYGRRIQVYGSNGSVKDGFKIGRHVVVVQVRET
jgi:hypothetical protein